MCTEHQKLAREVENLRQGLRDAQENGKRLAAELGVAQAGQELVVALRRVLGGGGSSSSGAPVDEEAIVARVLARVPAGGGGPITVTPPEKLRKDFQRDEADRILSAAKELRTLQRRVLKLIETTANGDYTSQNVVAQRLGRSTGGQSWMDLGKAVKELAALGFVAVVERQGIRKGLREKIAADLAFYKANDADVEAVYQNVLHEIATGAEA